MDMQEMLKLSHELQSWRPDLLTSELAGRMQRQGIPFCSTCADWHYANEGHSMTTKVGD